MKQKRLMKTVCAMAIVLGSGVSTAFAAVNTTVNWKQENITLNSISTGFKGFTAMYSGNLTNYMPIYYLDQALTQMGFTVTWNGANKVWSIITPSGMSLAANAFPNGTGQGTAMIYLNGQAVQATTPLVQEDPASGTETTYMPIWFLQHILTAIGVQSNWNGNIGQFSLISPSTESAIKPIISGFVTNYGGSSGSLSDLESHPQISEFNTFTDSITANGGVTGSLDTAAETYAQSTQRTAYVTVTNINSATGSFDGTMTSQILQNNEETTTLIDNLTNLVNHTSFSGINIDFESLPTSDRALFSQFISELGQQLHAIGKKLSVDVPAVTDSNNAYDYAAIGQASDEVIVMAYDYSYPGSPAGPIAPINWVNQVLAYTVNLVPANKILLGIPVYGYDWSDGQTEALSLTAIDQLITNEDITPQWDVNAKVPYFTYTKNGVTNTVYYENAESISDELALVQQYHLRGISIWRLGLEDQSIWQAIDQMFNENEVSMSPSAG